MREKEKKERMAYICCLTSATIEKIDIIIINIAILNRLWVKHGVNKMSLNLANRQPGHLHQQTSDYQCKQLLTIFNSSIK